MKTTWLVTCLGVMVLGPASLAAAPSDPCTLLTTSEVQQAFPGSEPGRLERGQEKNGILSCIWKFPGGILSIIGDTMNDLAEETPKEEAKGWTLTFLDPLRNDADRNVRYEVLSGVGDEAVAIVEHEDKAKGFLSDGAILVVRRGKRQVAALASGLGRRERADTLRILGDLGKVIAKRLN